jgi:glutamate synthase (NADPH/NADH) small chain
MPRRFPSTYALDEGGTRLFGAVTTSLDDDGEGRVAAVNVVAAGPAPDFAPVPGSERCLPAELVLVAIGFSRPERDAFLEQMALPEDGHGNISAPGYATAVPGVFACGDARRGQSLVVWAINEARECAVAVDAYLRGLRRA